MPESTAAADDETLLREALADTIPAESSVLRVSREPLGSGSVTGFTVGAGEESAPLTVFVDTSGHAVRVETGAALPDGVGGVSARVWLHPADPHLPALAPAAFGHAAAGLLARAGIAASGSPAIVAYRPGRRAVLRVTTADAAAWIKVVRPERVERIVELHGLLLQAGLPVPAVRAWSPEGLIILADAPGFAAIDAEASADALLDAVDGLRDRLATVPFRAEARTGLGDRIGWYATRLGSPLAADVAGRLRRALDSEASRPRVGIHGDLHLGQLFVQDAASAEIVGLIDVDTAGLGDPADDAAAFLAHAIASSLLSRGMSGEARLHRIADRATTRWADDVAVRTRTAIHLLGHAVGADDRGDEARRDVLLAFAVGFASPEPKNPLTAGFETA